MSVERAAQTVALVVIVGTWGYGLTHAALAGGAVQWDALGAALFIVGPLTFALVDALSRPATDWAAVGRSKALWVAAIVMVPLLGTTGYLIVCRPALRVTQRL